MDARGQGAGEGQVHGDRASDFGQSGPMEGGRSGGAGARVGTSRDLDDEIPF